MKTVDDITDEVFGSVSGDHLALMVFGSFARGQSHCSDIDVLQLKLKGCPSYKVGRLSFSVYEMKTLGGMAQSGDLFVLHLLREGILLSDPDEKLKKILLQYAPPVDYEALKCELRVLSKVLDVGKSAYSDRWIRYNQIGIRGYSLYAT